MSTFIFLSVLAAALLHASWNALIKTGDNKLAGMVMLSVGQGIVGLIIVSTRAWPEGEVWPWLIASGVLHAAYQFFLGYAYEQGDLSRVYPIARGGAPMIVLLFSGLFLGDQINFQSVLGILTLGGGIFLMARGVFTSGESRRLLPFAIGSACATAGYSIVDGLGARISGDPVAYVSWMFALTAVICPALVVAVRGTAALRVSRRFWLPGMASVAASFSAYAIAVWAMTEAPIALVTALRETSILFAVLIGWLLFGERMTRSKAGAAVLIVLGVILTRI